jgi:hypothetical protein
MWEAQSRAKEAVSSMRNITKAAALALILAVPGAAFAAQAAAPAAAKKTTAKAASTKTPAVSTHTTSGVVKSASDSALVISHGGKDETFVVNASTEKKGTVEPGAKVAVHYTVDGKNWVATAITAQPAKAAGSKSKGK